jgi:hypothetical protein
VVKALTSDPFYPGGIVSFGERLRRGETTCEEVTRTFLKHHTFPPTWLRTANVVPMASNPFANVAFTACPLPNLDRPWV